MASTPPPLATEAASADPFTSRARPTFLYVMYALLLGAFPMAALAAVSPVTAAVCTRAVAAYLDAIPQPLYALFGTGYLGYTVDARMGQGEGGRLVSEAGSPYRTAMTDRPVVLIAQPHLAPLTPLLEQHYDVLRLWESEDEPRIAQARAIVAAGEFAIPAELIERMPDLGLIACLTVGYDGIDVEWARARGIAVSHAHDANDEDVADHAIGLIIGHIRAIVSGDRRLRAGGWSAREKPLTRSLGGMRIGIVGLGSIGIAVARRAEAMRMRVSWWGPNAKPDAGWPRIDSLIELARQSDVLVVAARAHAGNVGLISAEVIAALGPQGLLVNIARGQLVDEDALIAALRDGSLGGAALDVFESEPTSAARWADVPNTVLTPHTAGATQEAVAKMAAMLMANLAAFFAGEKLPNPAA